MTAGGARPRLAFSTLGCPGVPLADVAHIAASRGYSGVELRAAAGEPVHVGLDAAARRAAAATLAAAGVAALAVASYVQVADPAADDEAIVADGIAHGRLAADVGAQYLRVFPGGPKTGATAAPTAGTTGTTGTTSATGATGEIGPGRPAAPDVRQQDLVAARRLEAISRGLSGSGVTVALETHDSHPRGRDAARILYRCPDVAAIWDALHTWRAGEPPADTVAALAGRLAYVQVKDVASRENLTPLPPGDGVVPLPAIAAALRAGGYAGWVSWEYERAWFPDSPPLADLAGRVARRLRAAFDPA